MFIGSNPATNEPRIGIGTTFPAASTYLHLGSTGGGGYRSWMNVGTYYNITGNHMYVGMRNISTNANEEIINFGDDGYNPSAPALLQIY